MTESGVFHPGRLYSVNGELQWIYPTRAGRLRQAGMRVVRVAPQPPSRDEYERQTTRNTAMQATGTNGRGSKD